ncbi:restriction endonuclease [Lewinella sp. JB7]|uniref:restriction endonuclease n=1 Tax=Lewinella sp. JB7 TaxID=2962887 RepID=UPI0020C9BDCC|nr:restriction endonuclease [Lewinella sp. JB7]MCP9234741.1 restriction endonuclease [Lewinella sp. JB7]
MATLSKSIKKQLNSLLRATTFSAQSFSTLSDSLPQEEDKEQLLWEIFTDRKPICASVRAGILDTVSQDTREWPVSRMVRVVRRSQAFLQEEWATALKQLPLEGLAKHHQQGWKEIKRHENLLWSRVEATFEVVDQAVSAEQLLGDFASTINYGIKFVEDGAGFEKLRQQSASTYNLLVSLYFKRYRGLLNCHPQQWFEVETSMECLGLFVAIDEYLAYYEGIVTIYSYDENFGPTADGLTFEYYNKALVDRWHEDCIRPLLIENLYESVSNDAVQGAQRLIADTCCETIIHNNKNIDTLALAERLIALSSECEGFDNQGIKTFTLVKFREYFDGGAPNSNLSEYVLNKLVFTSPHKPRPPKTFDRFGWRCDVDKMPFLRVGDIIFCCKFLMATNAWVFSTVQLALESYQCCGHGKCKRKCTGNCTESIHRTTTALELEKVLGSHFEQRGYQVKYPNSGDFGPKDGDVDLIVSDGKMDLIIQCKRSYVRSTLKDASFERSRTDGKAVRQLEMAEEFLFKPNKVYRLKKASKSWTVSTSFENLGTLMDGIQKVNYYELHWTLHLMQQSEMPLSDFCKAVESYSLGKQLMT